MSYGQHFTIMMRLELKYLEEWMGLEPVPTDGGDDRYVF